MSPGSKIIGMLIGLPIREYFMFAVTMPFVIYAAWVGGVPFIVLLKFYLVFISSALVYHMTGLAAGMVVDKPWRAGTVSQGLIVVLYLFLPQVSHFGFTFFEFLTARPVFYGLVEQHILYASNWVEVVQSQMDQMKHAKYKAVPFYGTTLPPTLFSLVVQAYALISLYVIVHRKWQSETRLPFSKGYALLFFAVAQLFLVGSILPVLRDDHLFTQLAAAYGNRDPVNSPKRTIMFVIFLINLCVSGCASVLTVYLCTSSWYQSVAGLRRSIRRGANRLAWTDDAATSLPVAAACFLMSWLSFIAVYQTASSAGRLAVENPMAEVILPLLIFAAVLITVQQIVEQFSERVFVMLLFGAWLVPVLVFIIVGAVFDRVVLGFYIAIPFPFFGLLFSSAMLMSDATTGMDQSSVLPSILDEHYWPIVMLTLVLYGGAAFFLLMRAVRRWQRIKQAAGAAPPAPNRPDEALPVAGGSPQPVPVYAKADDGPTPG